VAYNPHSHLHAPDFDPESIASRVFAEARRGYEPTEVQAYLQVVAEEFRAARQDEHQLRLQIADLERQLLDTEERVSVAEARARAESTSYGGLDPTGSLHELDEVQLTILVGEETAKVLAAARNAASEIRANAERTAAEMHRKATEAADQVVVRADEELERRASDAEADARRRLDETDAAIGLANAEAAQQRERLLAEAERTAAATIGEADAHLDDARASASRLVDQARSEADDERARGEAEATAIVAEAEQRGQQMMAEVRQTRTNLLEELLQRRKRLRRQVEQLHAGRERFLIAFESARDAMATIDDELSRALPEARAAAEAAARRADDRPDRAAIEVEQSITDLAGAPSDPRPTDDPHGATETDEPGRSGPPAASVFSRLRADSHDDIDDDIDDDEHEDPTGAPPSADDPVGDGRPPRRSVPHLVVVPRHHDETDDEPVIDEPGDEHQGLVDDASPNENLDDVSLDDDFDPTASRDALLVELTRPVVRRMKRLLTDEQNEVLDAVRRRRPLPPLDELLSTVSEHERRYAEATVAALGKAAAAGRELPAVLAEELGSTPSSSDDAEEPPVRDLAAALAVDVVGGLRTRLEACLTEADLLRIDPMHRTAGTRAPTKAAIAAQADAVAGEVRLAYRDVRTHQVDAAVAAAVRASFVRGLVVGHPTDLARRLLEGLDGSEGTGGLDGPPGGGAANRSGSTLVD
jgi:cell division septum initiation protein DivIVA